MKNDRSVTGSVTQYCVGRAVKRQTDVWGDSLTKILDFINRATRLKIHMEDKLRFL